MFQVIGILESVSESRISIRDLDNDIITMDFEKGMIYIDTETKLLNKKVCFYEDDFGLFIRLHVPQEPMVCACSQYQGCFMITMKDVLNPWEFTDPDNTMVYKYLKS